MKRVLRVVSALSAGASLVWGIAKAVRKSRRSDSDTPWPPKAEAPPAKAKAEAPPARAKAESAPAPKPVASPAPKTEPAKAATKVEAAEPAEDLVVKGVVIYKPAALLAFVNDADEETLKEAGVKGRALTVLDEARPFKNVDELANTAGVGRRTLQALCAAADA